MKIQNLFLLAMGIIFSFAAVADDNSPINYVSSPVNVYSFDRTIKVTIKGEAADKMAQQMESQSKLPQPLVHFVYSTDPKDPFIEWLSNDYSAVCNKSTREPQVDQEWYCTMTVVKNNYWP